MAIGPRPTYADQLDAEFELLQSFIYAADKQGLTLPEDGHVMRTPEGWLDIVQPALRKSYSGRIGWPPPQLLSVLALAQHYGVPTRMLDWTERAWVAAYFAAIGVRPNSRSKNQMVVWALNQRYVMERWNQREVEVLIVTAPRATNPNLQAQAGLFTVHQPRQVERWPSVEPLEDVLLRAGQLDVDSKQKRAKHCPILVQITLPQSEARNLLKLLSFEGIDAGSIFPDLRGVVMSLEEKLAWNQRWTHPWGTMNDPHALAYFGHRDTRKD